MNKRDAVLSLLDNDHTSDYVPAAFFLHFDPLYHRGQAAIDKHLEFFNYTGMDFVKIQYEKVFPHQPDIANTYFGPNKVVPFSMDEYSEAIVELKHTYTKRHEY